MIGQVVGQYRFVEKLGEGGMGAVYKGIDMMVEREVAIKMLRPDIAHQPELVERFRSEAITLAKLNSPGIATLYNFFRSGEDFFMVMEFLAGRTLEQTLKQSGPMLWQRAVPLFCRILQSIEPAHRAGILHRDIKPANIMLTDQGGVKVMDFGIARVLGTARVTRVGRVVGTMEYIAPERIQGSEADARADIYSLGVVLYEMLSCHLPFEGVHDLEIMRGHVHAEPPALGTYDVRVPAGIERVVMRALAKRPRERFATCSEMEAALWNEMETAGWRRPSAVAPGWGGVPAIGRSEETIVAPAPSFGAPANRLSASNLAEASQGAEWQETVLARNPSHFPPSLEAAPDSWNPATVAEASGRQPLLDRLTWKHYAAIAFLAVVLGGGITYAFQSLFQEAAPRESVAHPGVEPTTHPAPGSAPGSGAPSGAATGDNNAQALEQGSGADQPQQPSNEPGQKADVPPPPALAPGIYADQGGRFTPLLEESVNWKKGSSLRRFTVGFGKDEFVGSIPGASSPNEFQVPVTFRIAPDEGFTAGDYALVLLHPKDGLREVKVSGAGTSSRNLVHFGASEVSSRIWEIQFTQGPGEYGFLPPVGQSDSSIATKMYTFRVIR